VLLKEREEFEKKQIDISGDLDKQQQKLIISTFEKEHAAALESLQNEEIAITIVTKIEILRGRIDYLLKAFSGSDLLKAQELFS
jgi:hypothetical protein